MLWTTMEQEVKTKANGACGARGVEDVVGVISGKERFVSPLEADGGGGMKHGKFGCLIVVLIIANDCRVVRSWLGSIEGCGIRNVDFEKGGLGGGLGWV
jgi:hypothetical protein